MVCFNALAATANFKRGFQIAPAHEPVDQACSEAVAAADPVNQAHGVALALKEGLDGRIV